MGPELWPMHVFIWGEMGDAAPFADMLAAVGFKPNSPVIVIARSGRSRIGKTARLVWHPVNERSVKLPEVLNRIDATAREGLSIIAIDTESDACSYDNIRAIHARAQRNGLFVIHVPKALLDHLPGTESQDCAILNDNADAALLWLYGSHWDTQSGNFTPWVDIIRMWHNNHLTIQAIPMCDSGRRAFEPYNSERDIIQIIQGCHKARLSFGIFNPRFPESREELTEAARLYA